MGGSTAASNAASYPGATTRNTRDNFVLVAGKLGLDRRDIPSALTFFAPVRVDDDGDFRLAAQALPTAATTSTCAPRWTCSSALSNCPHPLDPDPGLCAGTGRRHPLSRAARRQPTISAARRPPRPFAASRTTPDAGAEALTMTPHAH